MRLLARALVTLACLLASVGCDDDAAPADAGAPVDAGDEGASRCYGGYGIAVHVLPGECPQAFSEYQLRLASGGAEHSYNYGALTAYVSERWPRDFRRGEPGTAELVAFEGDCALYGTAAFVVDFEACVTVQMPTTCTCGAADAAPR